MIISSEERTIIKDRLQNKTQNRINREQLEELGIPRLFQFLHVGDHSFSNQSEAESTIQFTKYGDGYCPSRVAGDKQRIFIEGLPPDYVAGYSSSAVRSCPILFSVKDRSNSYDFAGFSPQLNYLIITGINDANATTEQTLNREMKKAIQEIFNYIKKGGFKPLPKQSNKKRLMMGCDPEFSLARGDERVQAADFLKGGTRAALGTDGASHTGELRPSPAYTPLDLVRKGIKPLLKQLMASIPSDIKATTGGGFRDPLGDHIHFNKVITSEETKLLDDFVGIPCTKMKGGARATGEYGRPGDVRNQPHGVEYRTCPSTLVPGLLEAKYVTAYCVIIKWEKMKVGGRFSYKVDKDGIPTKEDYLALAPTERYKEFLKSYYEWVKHGEVDTRKDFLSLWFKRETKNRTPKFRAIVTQKPDWMPPIKRISIKGLTEEKHIVIDSYGPTYIKEEDNIPKGAVILGIPPSKFTILEGDEEKVMDFFKFVSDLLNSHIALQISSETSIEIRFPHTWREKKREFLTPVAVKKIVRTIYNL